MRNDSEPSGTPPPDKIPGESARLESSKPTSAPELPSENPHEALPPSPAAQPDSQLKSAEISDDATSKAVDDIASAESDTLLAVEDAANKSATPPTEDWRAKLKRLLKNKWAWLGVAAVIIIVAAVPFTRYAVAGLFIKKQVTVTVVDSKTATPVSSATVMIHGQTAKTDANGKAALKVKVGAAKVGVTKQYYTNLSKSFNVGFGGSHATTVRLVATGRLVPVSVVNSISGKPLAGAEIKVLKTTAKTDAKGQANIVLPAELGSATATISANGFNTAQAKLTVTGKTVPGNTFRVTPAGQVYFLSNSNGTIDVVKTNLDGTGRQVVLPGTGKEDPNDTNLLATRDWRYLVLHARREGNTAALYLIDTASGKVTAFDQGDAAFNLIGWSGHSFVYSLSRNNLQVWQGGQTALKSYNAETNQLSQLDQTQAQGDQNSSTYQLFDNYYITSGGIVYTSRWLNYGSGSTVDDKNATVKSIQANGTNKKEFTLLPADQVAYVQAALKNPQDIYYAVYSPGVSQPAFYEYAGQSLNKASNLSVADFSKEYPTYLVSPAGSQTFWTEVRDGRDTFFLGDANAANPKQIASLDDYGTYGWYTNDYVLLNKHGDELYIMPATGLTAGQQPLKISSYYKPARSFSGYGYGYGGL